MSGSGRWRYIAQRMTDAGPGPFIDFNLPLEGVDIEDILSGHNGLNATITPEYGRLKDSDGKLLLEEGGTLIWAEDPDGEIRGGGLLTHSGFSGPTWTIECTDVTGTSIELPYTDANYWIDVDPIDLFRYIWGWIQGQGGGNVGIDVEVAHSPVRLGNTMIQRVDFDLEPDVSVELTPVPTQPNPFIDNESWVDKGVKVMKAVGWNEGVVRDVLELWLAQGTSFGGVWVRQLFPREAMIRDKVIQKIGLPPDPPGVETGGPDVTYAGDNPPVVWEVDAYKLAWYKDHNLAAVIDDLATLTPFDWHLTHHWVDIDENESEIRHLIRVGYPKLGRRLDDMRFVIGENVTVVPDVDRDGTRYATEVLFLGAGEGSAQVHASAFTRRDGRVRKVAVVSDPSVTDQRLANLRADQELASRVILDDITEIVIRDHPNASIGSVTVGDEFFLEGETGWVDLEVWVRVLSRRISPDSGDTMTLTVMRTDRLT